MNTSTAAETQPVARRWTRRRVVWLLSAIGIGVSLLRFLWIIFGWPPAIVISRETTWVTEPLTEDGYVDFLELVRRKTHADLTTPPEEDPWFLMEERERRVGWSPQNADVYRDPVDAFRAGLPDESPDSELAEQLRTLQTDLQMRHVEQPISTSNLEVLAAGVEENNDWYAAVRGSYDSRYPLDVNVPSVAHVPLQHASIHRQFGHRFCLRAAVRFAQGRTTEALDDIRFVYSIAAREDNGIQCAIQFGIAKSIEHTACSAATAGVLAADELTPSELEIIRRLPSENCVDRVVEACDQWERVMWLDLIQNLHRRGADEMLVTFTGPLNWLKAKRFQHSVDWNFVLRDQNQLFDRIVAGMRLPTWEQQRAAIKQALVRDDDSYTVRDSDLPLDMIEPWTWQSPGRRFPDMARSWHVDCDNHLALAHSRGLNRRAVQIAARLALWKQQHGSYPAVLAEILSVDGMPGATPGLIEDPFTSQPLVYRREGDGFVMYSLGKNMTDDGGGQQMIGKSDSGITEDRDDLIWRWPPRNE